MTCIADVIHHLESIAPPALQASYDNSGLICGDSDAEVQGVLCSLDVTDAVLDEAIALGCNLVVSHHPIVFSSMKRWTGRDYVTRILVRAIKEDIALYALHTNLDSVWSNGVNEKWASILGLEVVGILRPYQDRHRYEIVVPDLLKKELVEAIRATWAQDITASRVMIEDQSPIVVMSYMDIGIRLMQLCMTYKAMCTATRATAWHTGSTAGAGLLTHLPIPMPESAWLAHVADRLGCATLRHTPLLGKSVSRVAICGGSGSFLLEDAIRMGVDVFITADYKYHQFFDADGRIVIIDTGHYESEQFTIQLIYDLIKRKFTNFATRCTQVDTNPVQYYIHH